jgi:predicted ribosome quality control (RQC) complex YloA/Tae2 family protein
MTPTGLHPYPLPLPTFRSIPKSTFMVAVQEASDVEGGTGSLHSDLLERIGQAVRREEGKVRGLRRQLDEAGRPDDLREQANLILSRLRDLPRGESTVTIEGWDGEPVELRLNPGLSPRENAEAFYEEAGRQERAKARLPALLEAAGVRLKELERLRTDLLEGRLDPEEVRRRVPQESRSALREGAPDERLPYHRFRSSGGLEIRVGRGARDNDELTFRHSHPDDVWLHARDGSGAHVVLRWREQGNPPRRDLAEAAILAALNSRARSSGTAPVDWTRRKYVRKPRKAPAGTVIPDRVQTVFVEVDPELPKRLRWDR